jgi:hypothetical protein
MEQRNFIDSDLLILDRPLEYASNNETKSAVLAFPYLYCPSRRTGPKFMTWTDSALLDMADMTLLDKWVVSDYAVPSVGRSNVADEHLVNTWGDALRLADNWGPFLVFTPFEAADASGPHRAAINATPSFYNNTTMKLYRSQTSFSNWVDGTSNQAVFGEKALHPENLGQGGNKGDFTLYTWVQQNWNSSGAARWGGQAVTRHARDDLGGSYRRFGSWHPGICQFAMGDASVQAINSWTDSTTTARMCHRQDGNALTRQ